MRWRFIFGLAGMLGVGPRPAVAEEPWSISASAPVGGAAECCAAASPSLPAAGYGQTCCRIWLKAYQNGLSRMMKSKCPMWPSCSAYSLEAIQKHGVVGGTLLTADRLYHEGSIQRTAVRIQVGEQLRYWDPVEDNVVWGKQP